MTDSIKGIFEHNIKLLGDMDKAVYHFREQKYDIALAYVANSINQINLVLEAIITDRDYFNLVDTESMLEMLAGILEAKKNKDYILLADLLELQLINFLIGVQELIISKEEIVFNEDSYRDNIDLLVEQGIGFPKEIMEPINTAQLLENGYRVEFTSCGLMTLAARNDNSKFYFHTNSRIQLEAFLLARSWYREDIAKYIVYGFGMGYHIRELLALDAEIQIEVYEMDMSVMQLACAFADIQGLLLEKRIKVIYDPDLELLQTRKVNLTPEEVLVVHYPSYKNIRCDKIKDIIDVDLSWAEL